MRLLRALTFTAQKHKGQVRRDSNLPYVIHPIIVSHIITKYKPNSKHLEDLQIAALFHDNIEDTDCSYEEIKKEFGQLVASLVMELTSDPEQIKIMGKNEYLKYKMLKMTKYSLIIKLADRYSNVLDNPKPQYVEDTIQLMDFLINERVNLTKRQRSLIQAILKTCNQSEYIVDS